MKKRMGIAKMLILCKWLRALDMTRKKELKTGFIKKGPSISKADRVSLRKNMKARVLQLKLMHNLLLFETSHLCTWRLSNFSKKGQNLEWRFHLSPSEMRLWKCDSFIELVHKISSY